MKHILIPTTYGIDTVDAMRVASSLAFTGGRMRGNSALLSISRRFGYITDLLFITKPEHLALDKHDALMRDWQSGCSSCHTCAPPLNEHHRFGITEPVFRQIMQRLSVDMVVRTVWCCCTVCQSRIQCIVLSSAKCSGLVM